jgi:RNA polymerase sigma factor (TIGR02999 family)
VTQEEPGHVTRLLRQVEDGSDEAKAALLELIHGELVRLAASQMRRQRPDHTLQPTALVNEAYLKLFHQGAPSFKDRTHFMAAAAMAMRSVLVDMARRRGAEKRGGELLRVTFRADTPAPDDPGHDVLAVHEALERLARIDPRWARVVEMRFFGGLSVEETAASLGVSEPTIHRDWNRARAWLFRELAS